MPIIAILSAKGCSEIKITSLLSEKLNYPVISDENITEKAALKFNLSKSKLTKVLFNQSSLFFSSKIETSRLASCFRISLLETVLSDNLIYFGVGSLFLPATANHILKICLGADFNFKVKNYCSEKNLQESEAIKVIKKSDKEIHNFARSFNFKSTFAPTLYDMSITIDKHSIEDVLSQILKHSSSDMLKINSQSKTVIDDALLSENVLNLLLDKKHDVKVTAQNGNVKVFIKNYKIRMENYIEKVRDLVSTVKGVNNLDVTIGTDIQIPSPSMPIDIGKPEKILLVDDEVEFVDALSERLLSRNFKTSVAYSGEEALESLNKDLPDVIILDLKMPGIDGIEVLRRVKKEHPQTEVVILTGHGSDKEKSLAIELGAFAYLEKPVNINILSETMKKAYAKINMSKS